MKLKLTLLVSTVFFLSAYCNAQTKSATQLPKVLLGNFIDDYGISYNITDSLWHQLPRARFHIIKWNVVQQYLIARNDEHNPGEGGLYTRIDFMQFTGMDPWKWGYCLTVYNAKTEAEAEAAASADREHPKKGCNGFPFSRMKQVSK